MYCDLDGFKIAKEKFGEYSEDAGNGLMLEHSKRLKYGDIGEVYRKAGDEFLGLKKTVHYKAFSEFLP